MPRVSLPKNFQQAQNLNQLKRGLVELVNHLENKLNNETQIYVHETSAKLDEGIKRRDLVFRIQELEGQDSVTLYWYDGRQLQSLNFNSLSGTVDPASQIRNFDFLHLTDTPDTYVDASNMFVRVKPDQTGLEFFALDTSGGTGSVTSVDAITNDAHALAVSGGPITTNGTLLFTLASNLSEFARQAVWTPLIGGIQKLDMSSVRLHAQAFTTNVGFLNDVSLNPTLVISGSGDTSGATILGLFASDNNLGPGQTPFQYSYRQGANPYEKQLEADSSGNWKTTVGSWDSSNRTSAPSSPSAGFVRSYWRDGSFYGKNSAGSEILVGPTAAGLFTRDTQNVTTATLADGSTGNVDIAGGKFVQLLKVETDRPAWVRFYTDTSARTTDSSRTITTDPTAGMGMLGEFITTSGQLAIKVSPVIALDSQDGPPSTNIPIAVTNRSGSSATVQVTITRIRME